MIGFITNIIYMKTPSFILSVLLLLFSQETIAQIVTRYSYDESGNVVSRRDIGYASHKTAKNISVADTASFANIYYDNNNCILTIKLNNTTLGAATNVNIYNATTRLKISSFSFDYTTYTYNMTTYPQGIYIVEAICGENVTTKKITR